MPAQTESKKDAPVAEVVPDMEAKIVDDVGSDTDSDGTPPELEDAGGLTFSVFLYYLNLTMFFFV